jgi:hypothetical protein
MSYERVYTLVPSTNQGRYALDDPDGSDLTSGQPVKLLLGGSWTLGRVEHGNDRYAVESIGRPAQRGYYFLAADGTVCGLCTGMPVRLS